MSGTIEAGAPWTRDAIHRFAARYPDEYAAIEAAIPDGAYLVLTNSGRYGSWGAVLMAGDDQAPPREVARTTQGYPTVMSACYAALDAGKVPA
jgi:hypothetical protein